MQRPVLADDLSLSMAARAQVFVRAGELRVARGNEFDIERAEWQTPAERMKMYAMHIVPLSQAPLGLLATYF